MESSAAVFQYPVASDAALKLQYVGKNLQEVEPPAAVIDRAVVRRNCQAMLDICEKLGVGFRAHIKSHKVSKMQLSLIHLWSLVFPKFCLCLDWAIQARMGNSRLHFANEIVLRPWNWQSSKWEREDLQSSSCRQSPRWSRCFHTYSSVKRKAGH